MDVKAINGSFSVQMGLQQSKQRAADQDTPQISVRNMVPLQAEFAARATKIQRGEKSQENNANFNNEKSHLADVAKQVHEKLKDTGMKISIETDEDTQKMIVFIKDPVTDEVVRKIPPEQILKSAEAANYFRSTNSEEGRLDVKI